MISFHNIFAIILRYIYLWKNDLNVFLSLFYWPLLDVFTWGFLGTWIQQQSNNLPNFAYVSLLGVLLWAIVGRGCNLIVNLFAEELWSNNIINLFSLPLKIIEWMIANILLSCISIFAISAFSIILIKCSYNLSIIYILKTFFIFCIPLIFSAIWIGFSSLSLITIFGKRSIETAYVMSWLVFPFSGAYYPIEILPIWAQKISAILPTSYVFNGMREYVMYQKSPIYNLIISFTMSLLYATFSILLFLYCFKNSKKNGLSRLSD